MSVPYLFTPGTLISAQEVNTNTLNLDARIDALAGIAISAAESAAEAADSELAAASAAATATGQAAIATAQANAATFATLQRAFQIDNRNTYTSITPSSSWTGVAGSGFSVVPTDPTRVTAKPAMRIITPPHQAFTDYMVVGVIAGANNKGNLLTNLGLQYVRVYYEGSTVDITEPSYYSFLDVNGVTRSYFGWWAVLRHNGVNMVNTSSGGAEVYFEAVPRDTTMQNRVIGPFRYYPRASIYDVEITIEPSQPVIAGSRYQTLYAASEYVRTASKQFAHFTIKEPGIYDWASLIATVQTWGYTTVDATVPVTIGKAAYNTAPGNFDANNIVRPRLDPIRFKGSNITLDYRYMFYFYHELPANRNHWLDGVNMTSSAPGGRSSLWAKRNRNTSQLVRDRPYFTEVNAANLNNTMYQCGLARGCTLSSIVADIFTESDCVVYNRVNDCDSSQDWNVYRPAMTVKYTGAGTSATIECSGTNTGNRVLTAKVSGSTVWTFSIGSDGTAYNDGTTYNFSNVVAFINSQPDWTATLLDDTYAACAVQTINTIGPFGATNCFNTDLTLYSYFDIHADFYQKNSDSTIRQNVVIFGNVGTNLVTQNIFLAGTNGCADILVANNCFDNKDYTSGAGRADFINSQLGRGSMSHVVLAHNSNSRQGLALRVDQSLTLDTYCLISDNVYWSMGWSGTPLVTSSIVDNHLFAGSTVPANAIGTTVGGDGTTLFLSSTTGDFTPAGALLTNQKAPSVRRSLAGNRRGPLDCAGAI